jgi:hypothetical protein
MDPVRSESAEPERTSSAVDDLLNQLEEQHQQVFQPSDRTVETVEVNEATPWLRRTQWSQYLAGQHPETLSHGGRWYPANTSHFVWLGLLGLPQIPAIFEPKSQPGFW